MKENKNVIEQCASAFIATLSKEELAYCTDKERGDYMGFSALHDLMDANVELMIPRAMRDPKSERLEACNACDPVVEKRHVDPRKRVGRAMRVRGGEQLELQLQKTIRRN